MIVPLSFLCEVCRMDDGLVEVVGLSSSLHVGRIQVNVDEPLRIGQAREVKAGCLQSPTPRLPNMSASCGPWLHSCSQC